ncbi:MAG TPA: DUF2062 domain-containing protein [Burkholderiales bacterium]|nr:DUF2062 domain-containing protein [Burkholderiales bacterium]
MKSKRALRWLKPLLERRWLWHLDRRRVAAGAAIGVFFGFLIPIGQIPLSAVGAVALRANLPVAAACTLVSNPLTYVPIYILAYKTGARLLGDEPSARHVRALEKAAGQAPGPSFWRRAAGIAEPLALGFAVFAVIGATLTWLAVNWIWILAVRLRRARHWRHRKRA